MSQKIKLIKLSRRFGQPAATMAGIQNISGDRCVIIDCDLQDPPELIYDLINIYEKNDLNIVYNFDKILENHYNYIHIIQIIFQQLDVFH